MPFNIATIKRPVLIWMAIITTLLVAVQRIAAALWKGEPLAHAGALAPEWVTYIMVFWSLCLLLGAAHLWHEVYAARNKWLAMQKALSELETSYAKLKELEGWRDNLSHFIIHDIKHAVAGIDGSLQLLRRELGPMLSAETGRCLTYAKEFTEDLLVMVSTLLDIARLEAAEMPLNKTHYNLEDVMKDAVARLRSVADLRNVDIVLETVPVTLLCDRDLLMRIIVNLVSNAVRFAPARSSVRCRLVADDTWAEMSVTDRGSGVAPDLQAKLFEKVTQGRSTNGRSGSGFGLAFCRLAVEAHGGVIGVESPVDSVDAEHPGARFWFKIPCEAQVSAVSGMNNDRPGVPSFGR